MSISDADYAAWLRQQNVIRALLVEAVAIVGGSPVTRYMSNVAYVSTPDDTPANQPYVDIVRTVPAFVSRLEIAPESIRASMAWGDIVIDNSAGERDTWLDDGWDGQALTLLLGSPDWPRADFRRILTGVTADIDAPDRGTLSLKIRDKEWMLNAPVQASLIGGSGPNKDLPQPLCYGQCFNVEPIQEDAAAHKYRIHDGAYNALSQVYEAGAVSAGPTPALASGTFVLGGTPNGRITADVQGAKPGGSYLTTCADIVQHIVLNHTPISSGDLDSASFSAFNTTCPQALGLFVRERTNTVPVLDDLLASVGAFRLWSSDGLLQLCRLDAPGGTPVLELGPDDIEEGSLHIIKRFPAVKKLRLGYRKNWTVQKDGLAGIAESRMGDLGAEYLVSTASDGSVTTTHALALEPDLVGTLLVTQSDADAEAARRQALWGTARTIYQVRAFTGPFLLRNGDVIRFTHPRFGFAAGVLAVVVCIERQPTARAMTLEFFR